MSFTIIRDAEQDIAALVDAEYGRALGPIATGEHAVELLERFAEAHGVDPATIPTSELEARWKDFVSALTSEVEDVDGEVHKVADEVLHPAHAGAGEEVARPATGAAEKAAVLGEVRDPSEGLERVEPSTAEAVPDDAGGERVMPVTSAKAGNAICPTCDGWGEVAAEGGVKKCPTCNGLGEVPAHEEPQAHPTA